MFGSCQSVYELIGYICPLNICLRHSSSTLFCALFVDIVEIGGVEPPSKQGTNTLSTCLSPPSFSCLNKTGATNSNLICYVFTCISQHTLAILCISAPLYPAAHRLGLERCLVSAPCAEIRLIYCTSIRQREHSYCCQLNCYRPSFTSVIYSARHAYIPVLPAVKTKYPRMLILLMIPFTLFQ